MDVSHAARLKGRHNPQGKNVNVIRKAVTGTILAVACSAAFATGNGPQAPQANADAGAVGVGIGVGLSENHNSVTGYTSGYAVGNANSAYGVGGNATAVSGQGGTALSAPTQTVGLNWYYPAYQTITHNGHSRVDTNAPAYAPNIYPTAPCMGSSSVGGNFGQWLFGFSGGTSWTDTECQLQEAARNAPTLDDRVYVWCKTAAAKGAPSCAGIAPKAENKATRPTVDARRAEVATVQSSGRPAPGFVW